MTRSDSFDGEYDAIGRGLRLIALDENICALAPLFRARSLRGKNLLGVLASFDHAWLIACASLGIMNDTVNKNRPLEAV